MSTATESLTEDRDHRIDSVFYEFLSAIDRGESPDPAEWVARHPELAPDLEEHFRDLFVNPSDIGDVISRRKIILFFTWFR